MPPTAGPRSHEEEDEFTASRKDEGAASPALVFRPKTITGIRIVQ